MLLTIDVGNTNTTFAFFKKKHILKVDHFPSTKKDFKKFSQKLLREKQARPLAGIVVASVVPELNQNIRLLGQQLKIKPLFLNHKNTPLRIRIKNPQKIGADRLANAVGASYFYGKKDKHGDSPLLVIDIGTATTLDIVTAQGKFLGGLILPGPQTMLSALFEKCAQLPKVPFKKPKRIVGRNTQEAIQSGIFYSYVSLIEGLIQKIQKQFKTRLKTILTGGFSTPLSPSMTTPHTVDPYLTLKGLAVLKFS